MIAAWLGSAAQGLPPFAALGMILLGILTALVLPKVEDAGFVRDVAETVAELVEKLKTEAGVF